MSTRNRITPQQVSAELDITGSRIISQVLSQLPQGQRDRFLHDAFKVTPEPTDVPFPRPYDARRRLFFLWTLVATFHDIGIPIEHLEGVRQGLNGFLSFFGLRLGELYLDQKTGVGAQLPDYFRLMARFLPAGIVPNARLLYDRLPQASPYLCQALADSYGENNHGVISAVCLFNSFKETFLVGHHKQPEYDLSADQYARFVELVLEQDVARAALAIALHSLDAERYPKVFPIDFQRLPLTFLLILCDELQEAFRLEGISYPGITKLTRFPKVLVELCPPPGVARVDLVNHYVNLRPEEEEQVLASAAAWARRQARSVPDRYPEFLAWYWDRIAGTLRRKLWLERCPLQLRVTVYLERPARRQMLMICDQELGGMG